jgi:citrate lyase subunit beta-like protein
MHARRALLYMPGDDRHKIEKALTLNVDCICMDMEDGVAASRKDEARQVIVAALQELDFGRSEKLVRINAIGSGLDQADLAAILPAHPDGIALPKVESPEQIQWVNWQLETAELTHGWALNSIRLIANMESARGLLRLKDIATHPRLDALIFGAEDYAVSIGATRTPAAWEVFTVRSQVVMHAKAFGLQAIDMASLDFQDLDHLHNEAVFGSQLGYTGKQVIHPAQVEAVQAAFTPDDATVEKAARLVQAFELHQQEGRGAFAMDGKMVDMPLVKAAQNVLELARATGKG